MANLDFFDCNARIGGWINPRPEHVTGAAGLLGVLDAYGIGRALVHHAWSLQWDAVGGNEALLSELEGQDRLAPCFTVLPPATREMDPAEVVAACRGLRGAARAFPNSHSWRLTPWCAEGLLAALAEAEVPLFVEMGQTSFDDLAATFAAFPTLPIVLVNTSYSADRYLYPLWERGYNLRVSLETYEPFLGADDVVARFGADRLLFGSGLPLVDPGAPMAVIAYAKATDDEKRAMAGGNLAGLLRR